MLVHKALLRILISVWLQGQVVFPLSFGVKLKKLALIIKEVPQIVGKALINSKNRDLKEVKVIKALQIRAGKIRESNGSLVRSSSNK